MDRLYVHQFPRNLVCFVLYHLYEFILDLTNTCRYVCVCVFTFSFGIRESAFYLMNVVIFITVSFMLYLFTPYNSILIPFIISFYYICHLDLYIVHLCVHFFFWASGCILLDECCYFYHCIIYSLNFSPIRSLSCISFVFTFSSILFF